MSSTMIKWTSSSQGTGINKNFEKNFYLMKHFVQNWPVLGVAITGICVTIWNLGTHDFRYDFTIFFIYINSYMNS